MKSKAELLAELDPPSRDALLKTLSPPVRAFMAWDWGFWGRPEQQMPPGDWFVWLVLAGRGFGKTRAAVENIARMLRGDTPLTAPPGAPAILTIVADSPFDLRQYSIEGPSGFLNVGPPEWRPEYHPSHRTLTWANGCKALLFSAEDPETLRGASGSFFWWDELAKSRYAEAGWSNMMFGMREGNPRGIVTTTPRPVPLIKKLRDASSTYVTRGSTWDNRSNLSDVFYREVIEPLMGTRLGRQEIEAEVLEDIPGALWTRAMLEVDGFRVGEPPTMQRVVVAVDPSGTSGDDEAADSVGIVAAGKGRDGRAYVLIDATCNLSPAGWGRRVVEAASVYQADRIVAEKNFGGAMVEAVIRAADPNAPVKMVNASRGKVARAEPIAALYEQGRVSHVGDYQRYAQLEDQLLSFTPDGYIGNRSPDRADALIWALTDLMLTDKHYGLLEHL